MLKFSNSGVKPSQSDVSALESYAGCRLPVELTQLYSDDLLALPVPNKFAFKNSVSQFGIDAGTVLYGGISSVIPFNDIGPHYESFCDVYGRKDLLPFASDSGSGFISLYLGNSPKSFGSVVLFDQDSKEEFVVAPSLTEFVRGIEPFSLDKLPDEPTAEAVVSDDFRQKYFNLTSHVGG